MFRKRSFVLSIPYSSKLPPIFQSFKYNPTSETIEILCSFQKNVAVPYIDAKMAVYNPEILHNNNQSIYCLYNQRQLEKKTEPELY